MKGQLWGSLPLEGTEVAAHWDHLYLFLFGVCVVFFLIVIGPMIYFAIRYRARPGVKSEYITHHTWLEIIWTVVPTILVLGIFAWGWIVYEQMVEIPVDAIEIRAVAESWAFNFQYDDGRIFHNEVYVPVNKPIKILLTSKINDVLHGFFIPDFRVKHDAVPGMYTTVFFKPTVIGQHQVFCSQYCGIGHSNMKAKVIVLDDENWKLFQWGKKFKIPPPVGLGEEEAKLDAIQPTGIAAANGGALAAQGKVLTEKYGCIACHTSDGSPRVGPSYKGIYGKPVELSDGRKVMVDDDYIRESIMSPQAKIVKGFNTILMPSLAGQMSAEDINAIIAYIKSLKD